MPIHWQAAAISMIFGRHCEISKVSQQLRNLLGFLTAKGWVWKAAIAGLCGSVTHTLLMLGKAKLGILESFQPYQSLQIAPALCEVDVSPKIKSPYDGGSIYDTRLELEKPPSGDFSVRPKLRSRPDGRLRRVK
jgi:hypothetical protein